MNGFEKYSDEELLNIFGSDIEAELKSRGYEFGWYKPPKYAGEIYILVNPAFPNLVKIGYSDNVENRVKSFNNSGLPDPYHVYATYKVKKRLEDLKLHELIDSLNSNLRHARNKEFYEMSPEKAYDILAAIAEINGDEDLLIKNPTNDEFFASAKQNPAGDAAKPVVDTPAKRRVKPNLTFPLLGIPMGAELCFIEDENIKVIVNGDDTVEFEKKTYRLSKITRFLKERNGTANNSGSYQGGLYFTYHGEKLTDIRIRKELEATNTNDEK